jgi:hypothetical protein
MWPNYCFYTLELIHIWNLRAGHHILVIFIKQCDDTTVGHSLVIGFLGDWLLLLLSCLYGGWGTLPPTLVLAIQGLFLHVFLYLDSEKQQAINLFLGKFIPRENSLPLWDHPTDYYLHHVSNQVGGYPSQPGKRCGSTCTHVSDRAWVVELSMMIWL